MVIKPKNIKKPSTTKGKKTTPKKVASSNIKKLHTEKPVAEVKEVLTQEIKQGTKPATAEDLKKDLIPKIKTEETDDWRVRDLQDKDMYKITEAFLSYPFPDEAIQITYHKGMEQNILGYNVQYIVIALNQILGINHWKKEIITLEENTTKTTAVCQLRIDIGNWKTKKILKKVTDSKTGNVSEYEVDERYFEVLASMSGYGTSSNLDRGETIKGAETNAIKKTASFFGLGYKAYAKQLDEDFLNLLSSEEYQAKVGVNKGIQEVEVKVEAPEWVKKAKEKEQAEASITAKAPSKKAPKRTEKTEPKRLSPSQKEYIEKLYKEYSEGKEDATPLEALHKALNKDSIDDLTMAEASKIIDKLKKELPIKVKPKK